MANYIAEVRQARAAYEDNKLTQAQYVAKVYELRNTYEIHGGVLS